MLRSTNRVFGWEVGDLRPQSEQRFGVTQQAYVTSQLRRRQQNFIAKGPISLLTPTLTPLDVRGSKATRIYANPSASLNYLDFHFIWHHSTIVDPLSVVSATKGISYWIWSPVCPDCQAPEKGEIQVDKPESSHFHAWRLAYIYNMYTIIYIYINSASGWTLNFSWNFELRTQGRKKDI